MTISEIITSLKGVRKVATGFIARCPAHDDQKQSLSLSQTDGRILLNCFAGCPTDRVVSALGITWKHLFENGSGKRSFGFGGSKPSQPPLNKKIKAVYQYTDEKGDLLYENVRFEPKDFRQRQFDVKGNPVWHLNGVRRVPYRLPDLCRSPHISKGLTHNAGGYTLAQAQASAREIFLTEGEKDADAVRELGFTATSFKNWTSEFNKYLKDAEVVILQDHDQPGKRQADEAARIISGAARSVKVLDVFLSVPALNSHVQTLPEKHGPDISDYIRQCVQDEGLGSEEIAERLSIMIENTKPWVDANKPASLFRVRSGNEWLAESKMRPSPKMLFGEFWFEGELCILFADTNVGKSILAVQAADAISRGLQLSSPPYEGGVAAASADGVVLSSSTESTPQKVVYFDFELTDKQFESRFSQKLPGDEFSSNHYRFHDNFLRAEIDPATGELHGFASFEDYLNYSLDETIVQTGAKVLIIDNLTYLRDETENARNALPLMKFLKELKSKHNLSILALAHTPKRDSSKPLGRNDLQGSKMLINFCDSSFATGESAKDADLRYLKQIKARNTPIIYHTDNVLLGNIRKRENFLCFEFTGTGSELEHLRTASEKDKSELVEKVKKMSAEGKTTREIESELGISRMTVSRYLKQ